MGTYAPRAWWRRLGREQRAAARDALERVGLGDRGRQPLRRALRRAAPAGADRPRARPGRAGAAARRAARRRRSRRRASGSSRSSASCATRAGRCSSPPTTSSRRARFDLVLCLNGRQVAFGPPAAVLTPRVLEPTYGGEIVVLERRAPRGRRPAPRATELDWSTWLTDPSRSGIGQRALLEVLILGVACGPLGVWVVLYRQSYAAESLAHGMLPGLVLAALAGVPLGLGAARGARGGRGRDRAGRARRAASAPTPRWP